MLRTKKILIVVIALIMVISLAACGGSNNANTNTNTNTNKGTKEDANKTKPAEDNGTIDTSKFVTISYLVLGDKPKNGQLEIVMEKVNAIMKEQINAELKFTWIEWADWQTKYNLALASGEPIDLITIGTDWLDTWGNAQRGAFLPIDDLLPKYAPLTWDEIPAADWDESKFKDQIVLIPENHYTQWVNHGIYYRGDWAKEFGISDPIKDMETLGKYFQAIKDTKPDVVPFDMDSSKTGVLYGGLTSKTDNIDMNIASGLFGIFMAKSYEEKYTVDSPIFNPEFVNYAKMMKEWADKGYWREDVLNYKGDPRVALKAGKSGADSHHTQTYRTLRVDMDKEQPGSELQMYSFSDTRDNLISMSITHGGTSVGAHSKNPERALMAYELIRQNEEVYKLINYGIEGVQYEIVDGKSQRPASYDEAKHGFYTDFWGGRVDKFEIPSSTVWDGIQSVYDKYDSIKKPFPYGQFVFEKAKIDAEMTAISQVVGEMAPAIFFGKAGDPEKAVEAFRKKLKAVGYDKVMTEIQTQLDAYKKMIEG